MTSIDPKVLAWLPEPPDIELWKSVRRLASMEDVAHIALMPDAHVAEKVCVGAVVATKRGLYPDAVGGDVGCGMAAVRLDGAPEKVDQRLGERVLCELARAIPINKHRERRQLPESLETAAGSGSSLLQRVLARDGRVQFGSLGRGNHFLELQRAEESLWLTVHSGSRALGQALRAHYVSGAVLGGAIPGLLADSELGRHYLADMAFALGYAEASRQDLLERASLVLGELAGTLPDWSTLFDCHHNFVRRETHFGAELWVHRKGAILADAERLAIIPGSMGALTFHVAGRGCAAALSSSSHGAGRAMSRSLARRKISVSQLDRELEGIWYDRRLRDALRDEAPSAYKPISKVMRAQKELTRIVRRLDPVLSYKGA